MLENESLGLYDCTTGKVLSILKKKHEKSREKLEQKSNFNSYNFDSTFRNISLQIEAVNLLQIG